VDGHAHPTLLRDRTLAKRGVPVGYYISRDMSAEAVATVQKMRANATTAAPDHFEFVKKMRSTAL
jgi:hypothetical protein